jgi:hypothetical protein
MKDEGGRVQRGFLWDPRWLAFVSGSNSIQPLIDADAR